MRRNLQHYVQKFYLAAFVDPSTPTNIWVYDKRTAEIRSQGIGSTAAEFFYYSLENPDGSKNDLLDKVVIDKIENAGVPILRRWRCERHPVVLETDLEPMARYLAVSYVRSPRVRSDSQELISANVRQMLHELAMSDQELEAFVAANPDLQTTKEQMREAALAAQDPGRIRLTPSGNAVVASPFMLADRIAAPLVLMNWSILESPPRVDFVTSDAPVSVYAVDSRGNAQVGVGFGLRSVEITLSISPRHALRLAWRQQPSLRRISESATWEINRRMAAQAMRHVYAARKSRRLLALVQEAAASEPRHRLLSVGPIVQFQKVRHRDRRRR